MRKLGTRETAWVMLAFLLGSAGYLIAILPDAQKVQVFESLVVPITGFVAFAFGAKVYQARGEQ
ncbi:hypothetical protein [Rhodovulum euryhalinum]|uniref:Uncharacterized protein n=1 Tax=Rhodovulum euryhalinum TaxID=35805 RepID=A0A4V2S9S5_9RHOB|nr:hypothetical protein [Rhodovulum euryhalinum]TCO69010.1 hypothetical protein EV655_1196 [Rhodovulum euryhalinum]